MKRRFQIENILRHNKQSPHTMTKKGVLTEGEV
jgi:hypothetical protein